MATERPGQLQTGAGKEECEYSKAKLPPSLSQEGVQSHSGVSAEPHVWLSSLSLTAPALS